MRWWGLCLVLVSACDPGGDQIRLTWQGRTDTTITVTWRSWRASDSVVFGTGDLDRSAAARSVPFADGYLHSAELTDLTPGTIYYYQRASDEHWTLRRSFHTAPAPGTPFRFAVVGDTQDYIEPRVRVRAAIQRVRPDFTLHTGDLVGDGYDQTLWDRWFSTMEPLISRAPLMPAVGNHDIAPAYFDQFALPRHQPSNGSHADEAYYAFDYGDTHFVSLNTEQVGGADGPQARWLKQDLAVATARSDLRWIIVLAHRPPYSSGDYGDNGEVRRALVPLFEQFDVDLTFWGHEHFYERSRPLLDGRPVARGGVTYVVTGGGGGELRQARPGALSAVTRSVHHFVEVEVSPRRLRLRALSADGTVIDAFTINKDALGLRTY